MIPANLDEGEYLWTSRKLCPAQSEGLFYPWNKRLWLQASNPPPSSKDWMGDYSPALKARWEREVAACSNPGKGRELMKRVLAGEVNTPERLTSMIPDRDAREVWGFMRLIQHSGGVTANWGMDWPEGRSQGEWSDILWGELRSTLASKDWAAYHDLIHRTYHRVVRVPGWDWTAPVEAMQEYTIQSLEAWFKQGGGMPSPADPYGFCGMSNPALRFKDGRPPIPATLRESLDGAMFQWSIFAHNGWFREDTTEAVLFTLKVLWRMKWGWDVQVFARNPEAEYPSWYLRITFGPPSWPRTMWTSRASPARLDAYAPEGVVLVEQPVTPRLLVGVNIQPDLRFFAGRDVEQHRKAREEQLQEWGWLHPSSAPLRPPP